MAAGGRLDLDTYAGGFSAAGWHRLTERSRGAFRAVLGGHGSLELYAVDAAGVRSSVARWRADGIRQVVQAQFPLDSDEEWFWFELRADPLPAASQPVADEERCWVEDAAFWVEGPARPVGLGVALTTMDRPSSCVAVLAALADVPSTVLHHVVVVDHGSSPVTDHADFPTVRGQLDGRLEVVRQPNLGGSGGFSRGMAAVLAAERLPSGSETTHVLLLDDDIVLDPEVVRRAAAAVALGYDGLLGAHMLYTSAPTVLHSTGEIIDPDSFMWRTPADGLEQVDLVTVTPSQTAALRRAHPVDYSGWWLCLVPADLLRSSGLAMPFFIKWDDVELGLRAQALGWPTHTLPGVGVWHVPWVDKDTAVDWQVFYLTRNRLITAALHQRRPPVRLLLGVAARAAEHDVTMAYPAAELSIEALEAFLAGPGALVAEQARGLAPVLARQERFRAQDRGSQPPEVTVRDTGRQRPTERSGVTGREEPETVHDGAGLQPGSAARRGLGLVPVLMRAFVWAPRRRQAVVLPLTAAKAGHLGDVDEAHVVSPTGLASGTRRRNRRLARRQLLRIVSATARIAVVWPTLRRQYRSEADRLRSAASWEHVVHEAADATP